MEEIPDKPLLEVICRKSGRLQEVRREKIPVKPLFGFNKGSLMALKDEIARITPQQLHISAAFWDAKPSSEHAEWLRQRLPTYPILQELLRIRQATDKANTEAIDRFDAWIQAYQHLITIAERPTQYDVFLSYASADAAIAIELKTALEKKSRSCFLAEKDIAVGTLWENQIQSAMYDADHVILLITPNSIARPWVLMETGAAWALQKHIYPALAFVSPEQLVDPVRKFQARKVESTAQRKRLVDELTKV